MTGHYHATCSDGITEFGRDAISDGVYRTGRNKWVTGTRHAGGSDKDGCFVDICIDV